MLGLGAALVKQFADLLLRVNARILLRLFRPRQSLLHLGDRAIQRLRVKEAQTADRHVETAGRKLALIVQMQQICLDLLIADRVR